VITSVQRRWRGSVAEKIRLVEDALQAGISFWFVARKHGISPSLLLKWRQRMAAGGRDAVKVDDEVVTPSCASSRSGSASSSGPWAA
jgi:transposase